MVKNIEGIVVELLQHKDLPRFQSFIREHWRKDHIFVQDTSIFDFQHKSLNNYHYMVAKQHDGLLGVHGVIPQMQFDESLPRSQIFLGLWKVLDTEYVGAGILLYQHILNEYEPDFIGVIGYNEQVHPFYKWQGFNTGLMDHHVVLSPKNKYQIAEVPDGLGPRDTKFSDNISFELISQEDFMKLNTDNMYLHQCPLKSDAYIINRYINHPTYKYYVYAISQNNQLRALCVIRRIVQGEAIVLRFVDFVGENDSFALLSEFTLSLLEQHNAEYVDIYSYGLPLKVLSNAGFLNRQKFDGLVIPNYFEPLQRDNVELRFAYKNFRGESPIRLFKADGDQDRPSIIGAKQ